MCPIKATVRLLCLTLAAAAQVKVEQLLEAPDSLAKESAGGVSLLRSLETGEVVARVPGLALMYTDSVLGAPPLLRNLVATWGSLPKNLVLVTVRRVSSIKIQHIYNRQINVFHVWI